MAIVLPAAAVVLALGLLLGGIAIPLLAARLARFVGRRQAAARGELAAELMEILRGAPELAAYGREDDAFARVAAADAELRRLPAATHSSPALADAPWYSLPALTLVGVLAVAVAAHDAGTLDRVLVATLALLALSSFDAVAPLPAAARELPATLASGGRVLELIGRVPAITDPATPVPAPAAPVAVALEDVTARYGDGPAALDGVTLTIEPGQRVALVGPSGAGKTTVTNLFLRFLDPERGRVVIGGRDVRELRQEDVRRTFALAGQEAHVFASSIRENLKLGRPDATDDELVDALRRARLADWVDVASGWSRHARRRGGRSALGWTAATARRRAGPPLGRAVLLLDEPTAHLDPETAEALVADVFDAAGDRSVLLITHRPEGLDLVDEVVSLAAR